MIDVRKYKDSGEPSNGLFKGILIAAVVFIVISIVGRFFSELFNLIEIKEIGEQYTNIFLKNLTTEIVIQLIWFAFLLLTISFSLLFLRMNLKELSVGAGIFSKKR